jgi:predicted acetyltransferase
MKRVADALASSETARLRMNVTLSRATERDHTTLANLLHLYVHDFSELLGMKPSEQGWFSYPGLPRYWREPGRAAFLIRAEDHLAGFALTSKGSAITGDPEVSDVAEFFVVRGVRRQGVGRTAAHRLFHAAPGAWEVRVIELNRSGQHFWSSVIGQYTAGRFDVEPFVRDDGLPSHVFRFVSAERSDSAQHT